MPEYLTVSDFLANDSQVSKKIGGLRDSVDAVREQVTSLAGTLKNYIAETDAYRIATNNRLDNIDSRLDRLEQVVTQGFALIFARLGITAP